MRDKVHRRNDMTQTSVKFDRTENLKRMLAPHSVAIIGAFSKQDKAGYQAVKAFERFGGDVWPVYPQGGEILGRRVYKCVADIGRSPDLAILAVPALACVQAFSYVAEAGCGGAIIVSGGFAEAGNDGIERQSQLAATIARYQTRLLGPNTSGFVNPYAKCTASFVPGLENIAAGNVAVVAQSGGVNLTLSFLLQNRGVGVSLAVGLGNAVDIDAPDVIAHLANDPNTRALVVHLEGIARAMDETDRAIPL
jgi:acyl-CoA synthetase (NDP forming)